jgi:hypothetical protein
MVHNPLLSCRDEFSLPRAHVNFRRVSEALSGFKRLGVGHLKVHVCMRHAHGCRLATYSCSAFMTGAVSACQELAEPAAQHLDARGCLAHVLQAHGLCAAVHWRVTVSRSSACRPRKRRARRGIKQAAGTPLVALCINEPAVSLAVVPHTVTLSNKTLHRHICLNLQGRLSPWTTIQLA